VEQVVQLLIDQAMRRNPRGCWIDVDLKRPLAGLAQIEVRDYGRALAAPERERLLDTMETDRDWAVCRHIVERHGGTLATEFPTEGGLRVIVTLPANGGRVLRS
jgi:K+-sensing histidine kinase KdpD